MATIMCRSYHAAAPRLAGALASRSNECRFNFFSFSFLFRNFNKIKNKKKRRTKSAIYKHEDAWAFMRVESCEQQKNKGCLAGDNRRGCARRRQSRCFDGFYVGGSVGMPPIGNDDGGVVSASSGDAPGSADGALGSAGGAPGSAPIGGGGAPGRGGTPSKRLFTDYTPKILLTGQRLSGKRGRRRVWIRAVRRTRAAAHAAVFASAARMRSVAVMRAVHRMLKRMTAVRKFAQRIDGCCRCRRHRRVLRIDCD